MSEDLTILHEGIFHSYYTMCLTNVLANALCKYTATSIILEYSFSTCISFQCIKQHRFNRPLH